MKPGTPFWVYIGSFITAFFLTGMAYGRLLQESLPDLARYLTSTTAPLVLLLFAIIWRRRHPFRIEFTEVKK